MTVANSSCGEYVLRRPTRDDDERLRFFSSLIWPTAPAHGLATRWWWNNPKEPQCLLAEHRPSGEIAAICGARRTRFAIGDRTVEAVSISDWDVSPRHKSKGLGRQLVQQAAEGCDVLYTTSVSDSAAAAFAKLGWAEDTRVPIYLANPHIAALAARVASPRDLYVRVGDAGQGLPLDGLLLDDLWHRRRVLGFVGMVRDGAFLREHLDYSPGRQYRLALAFQGADLVGYLLFRILPRGSFRRLPRVRVGLMADLLAIPGLRAVEALVSAASAYYVREGVGICTLLATDREVREKLPRIGFFSAHEAPLRRVLGSAHTRCMFENSSQLPPFLRGWTLSLADNDMDLIFGSTAEAGASAQSALTG